MGNRKNDQGKKLGNAPVLLKKPEYGTGNYIGKLYPEVKWEDYRQEFADSDGFDKRSREENGEYIIKIKLPRGTELIRYGSEIGSYTAPKNTPYDNLGLPYLQETIEYHEYIVTADSISAFCIVKRGRVAPMFDSPGGGIQYKHEKSIRELIGKKAIREVIK